MLWMHCSSFAQGSSPVARRTHANAHAEQVQLDLCVGIAVCGSHVSLLGGSRHPIR